MTPSTETHTCIFCSKDFERRTKKGLTRSLRKGLRRYGGVTCSPKCSTAYNHARGSLRFRNNKSEAKQ